MTDITSTYIDAHYAAVAASAARANKSVAQHQHDLALFISTLDNGAHSAAPTPLGPTGYTKLIFDDEFATLDTTKWNVQERSTMGQGSEGNNELQTYMAANVSADGQLHLTAKQDAAGKVTSGMVTTRAQGGAQTFGFTHGVAEASLRCPAGGWSWPAFWLVGADGAPSWPAYGEMDWEVYGQSQDGAEAGFHYAQDGTHVALNGIAYGPKVAGDGKFHTYGFEWTSAALNFWLDGKKVRTILGSSATGIAAALQQPHTIILNLAVGGTGPSYYKWNGDLTTLPASLDVDYVRVWQ